MASINISRLLLGHVVSRYSSALSFEIYHLAALEHFAYSSVIRIVKLSDACFVRRLTPCSYLLSGWIGPPVLKYYFMPSCLTHEGPA